MSYGNYCMVVDCRNNQKEHPELSFFSLPKKMEIALKWIEFSGRKDIDMRKGYRVCSEHFSAAQIKTKYPRKLLYAGSIPSLKGPLQTIESTQISNAIIFESVEIPTSSCVSGSGMHKHKDTVLESEEIPTSSCVSGSGMHKQEETVLESEEIPTSSCASGSGMHMHKEAVPESEEIPTTSRDYSGNAKKMLNNKYIPSRSISKKNKDKRIQKLKKIINNLRCKLYRKRETQYFRRDRPISTNKATVNRLIQESKGHLSKEAHTLFANELRSNYVNKHHRRYDDSLREMCLLWYYSSPKGYKAISKCLHLPTPRTLRNWQAKLKLSPGISPAVIESLKLYFSKNTEQKQKICTLMFDEISLSEELHFDQSNGKVIGVVDIGTLRRNDRATTALVCMARGVAYNWKYVMGYWFLGHTATNEFLYSIVLDAIDAAQKTGLKVKAIISDQSPVNQSVAKKLGITAEQCFFFRNGEKIYFIYDTPHLLKSIRNNLAKYDLEYLRKPVSWKYIQYVCTSTNLLRVRMLPRITGEHLNITTFNAMRVKYAAQILSESVSVAMLVFMQLQELPAESTSTAEFISDMDKAFDCLNSSKLDKDLLKMRYAMSEDSPHKDFLIKIRDNFRSCKFFSKRSVPPCINGFIITINSVLQLADELRNTDDIPKLLTRHLNQDPLENFFATVRQQHGCCRNPNPRQFENGLRHNYITSISKLCSNSNCEEDFTFSLEKLKELKFITSNESKVEMSISDVKDIEDVQIDLKEKNAVFYVCGYMARKFLKLHPCETCSNILLDKEKLLTGQHQLFTYFKQGESIDDEKGLLFASPEFFNYIEKLEIIHNEYFEELLCSKQIVKELIDIVKLKHKIVFELCSSESSDRFLNLFLTIRCHWGVRFINQGKKKKVATKNQKLKNICHE